MYFHNLIHLQLKLEASIVERLQKLRQWQLEQQKQLLIQQQLQREMLTQKQDSIFKALELSIQELDLNEDILGTSDSNINIITCNEPQVEQKSSQILHNNNLCIKRNLNNF